MDNAVFETLLRVADSDGTIRTAAEERLKELGLQPGNFYFALKKKVDFLNCFFLKRVPC